jgi:alanyl-tRNA synthetase
VVVLGGEFGGKAGLVSLATKDVAGRGFSAGSLIREIAPLIGGGGGGRDEMAQAGGRDPAKLDEALAAAKAAVERELA